MTVANGEAAGMGGPAAPLERSVAHRWTVRELGDAVRVWHAAPFGSMRGGGRVAVRLSHPWQAVAFQQVTGARLIG